MLVGNFRELAALAANCAGNPDVHSLLVTLSNHTNSGNQPYNDRVRWAIPTRGKLAIDGWPSVNNPREERSSAAAEPESAFIWRLVLVSTNRKF